MVMTSSKKQKIMFSVLLLVVFAVTGWSSAVSVLQEPHEARLPFSGVPTKTDTAYHDLVVGFSFRYPHGYVLTGFDDFGGRVVLVRNVSKDIVLQIFVSNRKKTTPVTLSEIKMVSGMKVGQSKNVVVGEDQIPAVAFQAVSDGVATQEVWFARGSFLYQLSAYRTDAPLLSIVNSLTWK